MHRLPAFRRYGVRKKVKYLLVYLPICMYLLGWGIIYQQFFQIYWMKVVYQSFFFLSQSISSINSLVVLHGLLWLSSYYCFSSSRPVSICPWGRNSHFWPQGFWLLPGIAPSPYTAQISQEVSAVLTPQLNAIKQMVLKMLSFFFSLWCSILRIGKCTKLKNK